MTTAKARSAPTETASVRGRVLAAAAQMLSEQAADELSLRAIAEAAGVGPASIYHYFESKEDLLLSLALMGFEDLRRDILKLQADPEIASPMAGGHRAYFSFLGDRPELFALMFSDRLLARHEALRQAERAAFQAYEAAVRADNRIPQPRQESVALAIWALGRGMAAIIGSYPKGAIPQEMADKLFSGAGWLIDHPADE